jgi:hypothetical protein
MFPPLRTRWGVTVGWQHTVTFCECDLPCSQVRYIFPFKYWIFMSRSLHVRWLHDNIGKSGDI